MSNRPLCCAVLVSATFSISMAAHAEKRGDVGVVSSYQPPGPAFTITRDGEAKPLLAIVGAVVRAGDRIDLPSGGSIVVAPREGADRSFTGPGRVFVPPLPELGPIDRMLKLLGAFLAQPTQKSSKDALSRGADCERSPAPFYVPIVRSGAKVSVETRDIPLAWSGGCPPFSVALRCGHETLRTESRIPGRTVVLGQLTWRPGQCVVELRDAFGTKARLPITVAERAPAFPADLIGVDSPLGVIARALWLADQEDGAWRLDAHRLLGGPLKGGGLAGKVAEQILWGNWQRISAP